MILKCQDRQKWGQIQVFLSKFQKLPDTAQTIQIPCPYSKERLRELQFWQNLVQNSDNSWPSYEPVSECEV